ncbi:NAD(P)-dependent dehydrogenase (short-subunit alcohol dehydrogenase family) [Lipingzhangella halophila]|uniref:NAD(P)-dependent dehydrogenase (Short-subunit alcohol dehydrogenase family) n=1 Tax=Lipingzhangella halophila TaxID=1783352 RepID=A0A7W7W2Z6_9ACTN|nr:SDR family NAD(P)-dependent oxidoreductase [Lipingzhangella halophila]MBB4931215.1 NAD(P)-dependent dehydrogenase (short-subunit alcohol dehydrogenase family) [Lipingzhangella halophila]
MHDIQDKVAVITGGSSGIGRGIALAFARAGMRVVVTGRGEDRLSETEAEFSAQGLRVDPLRVDATDLTAMREAADTVERRHGGVHVLVNNAGIGLVGPVAEAAPDDWDWVIDVNIRGVGHGIQAFLPKIRAHGEGGHIVNTSSMGGLMPIVAGLYSMTKAAVIALSEALHIELRDEGIGVSAYCPGPTHSNIAATAADRPERYGESGYPPPDPARVELHRRQPYMSAREAGERVLQGVLRGDLFILTHPEFKEGVAERHATIEAAFPDEPVDAERAATIPFLLTSPVYSAGSRPSSPRRPRSDRHRP